MQGAQVLFGFIIAQVIIFVVIFIVLKRLIFQDTASAVNRLTRLDNMNRDKEKRLSQKLEETDQLLREKMQQMAEEEKRMRMEAERSASQLHDDIVKKAREEGEELLKKAFGARAKMRTDAMIDAESKIIDICTEILGAVLSPLAIKSVNSQLALDYIADLEKMDMEMVKNARKMEIISSGPLDPAILEKVKKVVSEKLKREIPVAAKEDPALIGGIVMKFGTMVVDDTLRERLDVVTRKMKGDLSWKHKTAM